MACKDFDVWMNGQRVGQWFWPRTGTPGLHYETSWAQSPNARPLSVSLLIPAGGGDVMGVAAESYFDNLLPDSSPIRAQLRRRFTLPSTKAADLLAAIGRDCVGAVQLMPVGLQPPQHDQTDSTPLTDVQVERLIADVENDSSDAHSIARDFRISIAGAQEKPAMLRIGDRWHLPDGSKPTTHIFKLPLNLIGNMHADMTDSVENEWLRMKLLGELGFDVAPTEMAVFGR